MNRQEAETLLQQIEQLRQLLVVLASSPEGSELFLRKFGLSVHSALFLTSEALAEIKPVATQHGNFIYTGPHQPGDSGY
jgi:hypothetical protein